MKEIAPIVGGGGGGRPTMARAGGKDPEKLPDALARARELISPHSLRVKVLALDYGSARTGVAVSDPTGTVARPVASSSASATQDGFDELVDVIRGEEPELVVVGLPLTLRGEHGEQARRDRAHSSSALRGAVEMPVETYDERFTSVLAGGDDARAAAHLLSSYLEWLGR